jgi:hypothetical protein
VPRDLADVLHYFIPEAGPGPAATEQPGPERSRDVLSSSPRPRGLRSTAALPLIGVPIGERDVVRAAFTWNLMVEVTRLGGRTALVVPSLDPTSALWPAPGAGPLGAEVIVTNAEDLGQLYGSALDIAVSRAADAEEGGVIFVRIPPPWLRKAAEGGSLLRWMLLFTSADSRDLIEAYGLAKLLLGLHPSSRVGVTVHGARRRSEAERAFERLACCTERHLGRDLDSYGLLVDDLHVYRAIVAQRPIGLAHPQSPAARALRDVARTILTDAREWAVG